ncbi:MAG: hypothetical protein AB7D47_13380 [Desulfovibrio sp.]|jgi:hypothetical protein
MRLWGTLAGKILGLVPLKWWLAGMGALLLLGSGYCGLRWQLAEAEIVRLDARATLLAKERDLARADQDALRRVAAGLRLQLETAQADFAAHVAGIAEDRRRLALAIERPAIPGRVVDDATSEWALDRLDALLVR